MYIKEFYDIYSDWIDSELDVVPFAESKGLLPDDTLFIIDTAEKIYAYKLTNKN